MSFSQTTFTINERDGVVTVELTLSRPTPCCVHLYVEAENIIANSKLIINVRALMYKTSYAAELYVHTYVYNFR